MLIVITQYTVMFNFLYILQYRQTICYKGTYHGAKNITKCGFFVTSSAKFSSVYEKALEPWSSSQRTTPKKAKDTQKITVFMSCCSGVYLYSFSHSPNDKIVSHLYIYHF